MRRVLGPGGEVVAYVRKSYGVSGGSRHGGSVSGPSQEATDAATEVVNHTFGKPLGPLGIGERLCNEPIIPKALYVHVYHVHFEILEGGDARCCHCGEKFLGAADAVEKK